MKPNKTTTVSNERCTLKLKQHIWVLLPFNSSVLLLDILLLDTLPLDTLLLDTLLLDTLLLDTLLLDTLLLDTLLLDTLLLDTLPLDTLLLTTQMLFSYYRFTLPASAMQVTECCMLALVLELSQPGILRRMCVSYTGRLTNVKSVSDVLCVSILLAKEYLYYTILLVADN